MTTDDFEWVEYGGFDKWYFMHRTQQFAAVKIYPYNGWHVVVHGHVPDGEIVVDSLDAAKTIATILVAQQMERFPDVTHYGKRASDPTLRKVQERIRKLA